METQQMRQTSVRKEKKMTVPFGTISIPEQSKRWIGEILETRRVSSGKYVRMFEKKFAELLGAKEAVAVSSGTDADILALAALHDFGAQRGDEVIVPALSFVATGNAVVHAGFKPAFVDIDRKTLNIDVPQIEKAMTEKTRAIMPVHLMGKPADMDSINALAGKHGLYVVEDAAEAHGALYKGRTCRNTFRSRRLQHLCGPHHHHGRRRNCHDQRREVRRGPSIAAVPWAGLQMPAVCPEQLAELLPKTVQPQWGRGHPLHL